jgi:Na+/glutamate symporter
MIKRFSQSAALFSILIGISVLCGWVFEIDGLKSFHIGWIAMRFNTALCFLFLGSALLCLYYSDKYTKLKIVAGVLSASVMIFGVLGLIQYLFGVNLGIDQLFFSQKITDAGIGTLAPGRMAANKTVNFVLLRF